jgi:hypothetical protein
MNPSLPAGAAPIPVSLLTGFLGGSRTTLLNHLITQPEMKNTLVIINEFGEIGLDHLLVAHSQEETIVEMSSGCLCCTIRGDLKKTLKDITWRFAEGASASSTVWSSRPPGWLPHAHPAHADDRCLHLGTLSARWRDRHRRCGQWHVDPGPSS